MGTLPVDVGKGSCLSARSQPGSAKAHRQRLPGGELCRTQEALGQCSQAWGCSGGATMAPCSLLSGGDWKKQSSCVPWPTTQSCFQSGELRTLEWETSDRDDGFQDFLSFSEAESKTQQRIKQS